MKSFKVFTLSEIQVLLPSIRSQIKELHALRDFILSKEVEIDALEIVTADRDKSPAIQEAVKLYQEKVNQFYDHVDQMTQSGYHLKDLEQGLIDFYGMYENQMVFFCWKWDEETVSHWHPVDAGFASRKPIKFENKQRP